VSKCLLKYMRTTFDYIAPFYDALAVTVFGNNLRMAKKHSRHLLPHKGNLLLMGGGTGNILNDLLASHDQIRIDFIEPSQKMLAIAKRRLKRRFEERVNFIHGNHRNIPSGAGYDAVTSFFVIDCLKQDESMEFAKATTAP